MVAITFLVTVMAFAWASAVAATAAYWDQPVHDRNTVVIVQQTLHAEGYDPGPVNGQLGPQTVEAVKQAQEDRELEPTGRLDRRTIAALGIDAESAAAGGGSAPQPVPPVRRDPVTEPPPQNPR